MNKKLALFDIDGTLITSKRENAHEKSFTAAIEKVFGIVPDKGDFELVSTSNGKTDTRIIIELLSRKGISSKEAMPRMREIFDFMSLFVRKNLQSSDIKINPGVIEFLDSLKNKGFILGLVTGNVEDIANTKLNMLNIMQYFQIGAFGDISEIRSKLVESAIKQAENKFNISFDRKNVFYFGDTPLDVECGKSNNVVTIAVATGSCTKKHLEGCNPDYIFSDLSDTGALMDIMGLK